MTIYKNYVLCLFIVAITFNIYSQGSEVHLVVKDVPAAVVVANHKMFPAEKNIKWSKVNNSFIAEFGIEGHRTSATFGGNGTWEETETEIEIQELPVKVKDAIISQYKGCKIEQAVKTISPSEKFYEVSILWLGKSKYLMLSENGTLLDY